MSGHQRPNRGASDTWLTPPGIIDALGPFDLDPCCPPIMPWRTATYMYHQPDDGFAKAWLGRIWLNPPFGPEAGKWLDKLADHGDGIALVNARTETRWFHRAVWKRADGVLFLEGRLHFHRPDGSRAASNAGAPSALVAYGSSNADRLVMSGIPGRYVQLATESMVQS